MGGIARTCVFVFETFSVFSAEKSTACLLATCFDKFCKPDVETVHGVAAGQFEGARRTSVNADVSQLSRRDLIAQDAFFKRV